MLCVPLRVALGHECHHQDKCCSAFTWDNNNKTTATAAIAGVKVKITLAAAAAAATAAGRRIFMQNVKGKNVDVCDPGAENRAEATELELELLLVLLSGFWGCTSARVR